MMSQPPPNPPGFPSDGLIMPLPHERPPEPPPQQNVGMAVAQHVVNDLVGRIGQEVETWIERHRVPAEEAHVQLSGRPGRIVVAITHQKNGLRIIGTPARSIKIKWSVG